MSKSDFFSFITSLKLIERRALGELSQVIHLDEGTTVYSTGEESDAFYIINRGAVEVIHESAGYLGGNTHSPVSYLSRGDMFGEIEVLSGTPRKNAIRACEPVSMQRFAKKDFPEIIRRIPSFFYYLCQQLTDQIARMTDTAFVQSHCLELSGNLANFDLVTIYQTILNSAQTGELVVLNEATEPAAIFYFEDGLARSGRFYHLMGEEAFWQLFLHEKLDGNFSFSITEQRAAIDQFGPQITRNPTDLLITALQYRDEFKGLMDELPDPTSLIRREKLNLAWGDSGDEAELRPVAEDIWQTCYSSTLALADLCERMPVCELKFYKTILLLLDTGHFSLLTNGDREMAVG